MSRKDRVLSELSFLRLIFVIVVGLIISLGGWSIQNLRLLPQKETELGIALFVILLLLFVLIGIINSMRKHNVELEDLE